MFTINFNKVVLFLGTIIDRQDLQYSDSEIMNNLLNMPTFAQNTPIDL